MTGRAAAAVALLALLLAPAGAGQEHHHAAAAHAAVAVLLDVGGTEVKAGDPAFFEAVVFGGDGVPDAHQDLRLEVAFAGRPLFGTTAASGHDYDGVAHFQVVFPAPGPFTARVLDGQGMERARLDGWALPSNATPAAARLEGPDAAVAGQPARFRVWPEDPGGRQLQHFYTLLEVRRGPELVYRAKVHGHGSVDLGPAEADIGFPVPGTYTVEATVFQAAAFYPQGVAFAPLHASRQVTVAAGVPALDPSALPPPPAQRAAVVESGDGAVRLVGTYDPAPQVAPGVLQHVGVLAEDPAGDLLGHDNFQATLQGPLGETLFSARLLHDSDGVLELATTQTQPGTYSLQVGQDQAASIALPFDVLAQAPGAAPSSAGQQLVRVEGFDRLQAGVPANVTLAIADAAGTPLQHADADVQVLGPDQVPILTAKLHAHGDGRFPFTVTPLAAGRHVLRVVPSSLDGRPVTFAGDALAGIAADAAPGEPWPSELQPAPERAAARTGPLPLASAAAVATAGLAGTALWAWRRRGT